MCEHQHLATPLHITQDDNLRFGITNAATGVTVTFGGQFLLPDGHIIPLRFDVVPATDRTETVLRQSLGEGWLLHLAAVVTAGTTRRGQCHVTASVQFGGGTNSFQTITLLSDYVSMDYVPSWPHNIPQDPRLGPGILRSIAGTDPAAGVECSDTVPTGARWRLQSWRVTFVTGAAAATRQVHLIVDDGTTILFDSPASGTEIISLTRNYNAIAGMAAPAATDSEIYIPLSTPLMLFAGYRIRTLTTALNALDNYGAPQIGVEEWLEL